MHEGVQLKLISAKNSQKLTYSTIDKWHTVTNVKSSTKSLSILSCSSCSAVPP